MPHAATVEQPKHRGQVLPVGRELGLALVGLLVCGCGDDVAGDTDGGTGSSSSSTTNGTSSTGSDPTPGTSTTEDADSITASTASAGTGDSGAIDTSTPLVHPETGEDTYDWTHANGVILSPDGSSFLISLRHQDWMVSVNRTSQEVEWRLGPDGDFALTSGRGFDHPHSPQWQDDGSLLLYDNAAPIAGDCDVLPRSDRILVTDSAIFTALGPIPRVREVDPTADPMTVWQLLLPADHFAYRTTANDRIVGMPAR